MYCNYKKIPHGKKCIHNVSLHHSFEVYNLLSWILKCVGGARIAHIRKPYKSGITCVSTSISLQVMT